MKTKETHGLTRIDENLLRLENAEQVDVRVFANEHVQIEATAVEELKGLLGLQSTLERFLAADAEAFAQRPRIERISLTPDFHKARGIPVGDGFRDQRIRRASSYWERYQLWHATSQNVA